MRTMRLGVFCGFILLGLACAAQAASSHKVTLAIRGVQQILYIYDPQTQKPDTTATIVVSGDGGWHGFVTEIAEYLAARDHTVVGFDAKAYLESMSKSKALDPSQVTADFAALSRFAKEQSGAKLVVLAGWSEGAGLVVLGGLHPEVRAQTRGVIAIGLPELNELAWRTRDAIIYITKKVPNEPTFNSKDYVGRIAPLPLMMIQSTHDDFVSVESAREIFSRAQEPKQIIFIDARDHRFEGQRPAFWQALDRALAWFDSLAANSPR